VAEFLIHEGVLKEYAKMIIVNEARGTMRLAVANPLTKEEWERLKELFEKSERDELTPEEAEEFLEHARKVVRECGECIETWKLHLYVTMVRVFVRKKHLEMKEKKAQQGTAQARRESQSSSNK
jgi:hypothetical protein